MLWLSLKNLCWWLPFAKLSLFNQSTFLIFVNRRLIKKIKNPNFYVNFFITHRIFFNILIFLCNSSGLLTFFSSKFNIYGLCSFSDHLNATRLDEKLNVRRVEFFYAEVFRAAFVLFLRSLTELPASFGGVLCGISLSRLSQKRLKLMMMMIIHENNYGNERSQRC